MARVALTNGRILMPSGTFITASLLLDDQKIVGIVHGDLPEDVQRLNVMGCMIAPGFIDTHMHGGNGRKFMEGTREAISMISRNMSKSGVTSCLATTTSAAIEDILNALDNAAAVKNCPVYCEMEILGVHLEGPYVNLKYHGAHSKEYVRHAQLVELESIWEAANSALKVVTLAPEISHGMEAVRYLKGRGVHVSIGHTSATYEETKLALASGISRATHLFNAMPSIHHRNPGPIPALFEDQSVYLELIVDGFHLHPAVVGMVIRQVESHRPILITDSADISGLGEGVFTRWKGIEVVVTDGQCHTHEGAIAGSTLRMDQGVKNLVEKVGLSVEQALQMAAENPARSIGVYDRKGSLEAGKDADIVVLRNDLSVLLTIIRGQIAYDARN
jgi:N-acetylglucosamine-6-phosphate deacetylase